MSEETKQKILDGALTLFTQHGIKSITMDEIAESLSISKRTIYENFKDKNTLVLESLKWMDKRLGDRLAEICKNCENVIEEMIATVHEFQCILKGLSKKYLEDIKAISYSNDYFQKKEMERQIKQEMKLTKGQEDGYIRNDIDPAILSSSLADGIKVMTEKAAKENPGIPVSKIIFMFTTIYIRGIATPKGLELIEKYEKKNKIA